MLVTRFIQNGKPAETWLIPPVPAKVQETQAPRDSGETEDTHPDPLWLWGSGPHPVWEEAQRPRPPHLGTGARGAAGRPRGAGHTQGCPRGHRLWGGGLLIIRAALWGAAGVLPRAESDPVESETCCANTHAVQRTRVLVPDTTLCFGQDFQTWFPL